MNAKRFAWLLLASAAVFTVTCAPIQPPMAPEPKSESVADDPDAEHLAIPPKPRPAGVKERIELAIDQVRQRDLHTTYGFWTVFHGLLGLGHSLTLLDPETGTRVNALDYICEGGEMRGLVFLQTKHGLDVQTGPLFVGQGHQDQFIAEMAQWGIAADRKFVVHGKDYTYLDFVRHAQMRARTTAKQELSWAIVVIGQYLGTDIAWTNAYGEKLHFEDLIRYELNEPIVDAACGGTHRLFGLSWCYHLHLQKGGKTEGVWQDLADHVAKHVKLARQWQNSDGAFSTNFFKGAGDAKDNQLRINTTGHILEWLALCLPDEELRKPWMQDAANALALMFLELQNSAIDGGPLYHAAHGLLMYYARVFDPGKLGSNRPLIILPPGWGETPKPPQGPRDAS